MNENKQNSNWTVAVGIFNQISVWIIVPIIVALVFGKMLDKHFGTKPVIFLVFACFGFLSSCVGIFRVVKDYTKKLKDIGSESKEENNLK